MNATGRRPSLDQRRADFAWSVVKGGAAADFVVAAKGAPALIANNGLMQAFAFWQEKGEKGGAQGKLGGHLRTWLAACFGGERWGERTFPRKDEARYEAVMEALAKGSSAQYREATDEALALLRWLRQFAAAAQKTA